MNHSVQCFDISKKASKKSKKVWTIENEYDDMLPKCIYKKCSRCKKDKHIEFYGVHSKTQEPLKVCETCVEYNKNWQLANRSKS